MTCPVHRIDGYTGAISVTAAGLPEGVTAMPLTLGPNTRWGVLVLNVAADAPAFTGSFTVTFDRCGPRRQATGARGAPGVGDVGHEHPARPGPGHRPARPVAGAGRAAGEGAVHHLPETAKATKKVNAKDEKLEAPFTVKQGEKFTIPVKVNWIFSDKQPVQLAPEPTAQNPQASPVTANIPTQPTKDKPEGVVNIDVKGNAPPGTYTITLKGTAQVPFMKDPAAKQKGPNLPAEVVSDPIAVTVIPSSLAKVTVGNLPNNALKVGGTGELTIKVERQYDFAGEFKVKFALPTGTTGVSAEEVTIPAGQNEVKLVLTADDDAKPGAVNNAVITLTAVYDEKHTITHEAKVNFTVAK